MRLLLWFLAILATSQTACRVSMTSYYRGVASAASAVSTGYRMLDAYDLDRQSKIVAKAKAGNPEGAAVELREYMPAYDQARKVLDGAAITVEIARSTGASIEAASDRDKRVSAWLVRLTALALDVASVLGKFGIKVTP